MNKRKEPRKKREHIVYEISAAKKPIVHARIHPELFRLLSNYCDYNNATKQDVISKALERFFRTEKNN